MERSGIKYYDVLLTYNNKISVDGAEKTKLQIVPESRLLKKTDYNELTLSKGDMVCFQIF